MRRVASIGAIQQHLKKEYQVGDLFFTGWNQVSDRVRADVYGLMKIVDRDHSGQWTVDSGLLLIRILKLLVKNQSLVDKINEEQAVDIFNSLTFLRDPFYDFTPVNGDGLSQPEEKMGRSTFDHFIYADNEYSNFLATQDIIFLKRLVATLYQQTFDRERVDEIAATLKVKDWQLSHTFFTYAQVREFVMKRCKTLLPKPVDCRLSTVDCQPTGPMWKQLKHRLSETPAFRGFENAGRANMYDALDYLEDLAKQNEERRRHANS